MSDRQLYEIKKAVVINLEADFHGHGCVGPSHLRYARIRSYIRIALTEGIAAKFYLIDFADLALVSQVHTLDSIIFFEKRTLPAVVKSLRLKQMAPVTVLCCIDGQKFDH